MTDRQNTPQPYASRGDQSSAEAAATRAVTDAPLSEVDPDIAAVLRNEVADVIAAALQPSSGLDALRGRVHALAERFPLYEGMESW